MGRLKCRDKKESWEIDVEGSYTAKELLLYFDCHINEVELWCDFRPS